MNREDRRNLKKQGATEETINKVGAYQSPCTIAEAVQISRASAEDVVSDYHRNQANVQLAMSLQIEILKEVVFSSGLITEDDFKVKYLEKAKEIQDMQRKQMEKQMPEDMPAMKVEAGDVEIKIEK